MPSEFLDEAKSIFICRSNFDCAGLITACEHLNKWEKTYVVHDNVESVRTDVRSNSRIIASQLDPIWDKALFGAFSAALCEYTNELKFPPMSIKDEGYQILKYGAGEQYKTHIDNFSGARMISGVMFLNDGFRGGRLEFTQHQIMVEPVAGSIILFPSNYAYPHRVLPPDSVRYSAVTWFH